MISLEKAIKTAEQSRESEVVGIVDCGDRWAFAFKADVGCLGSCPVFVYKDDGRAEYFSISDHVELLKSGTRVDLP